ncbi:MAG: hypothetical protein ABJB03_01640 [Rhodoglobus sp.]
MGTDALTTVANDLYALPAADFTAARNARAKEVAATNRDLAQRITALRKPTPAAWIANALVRELAPDIEAALAVGESMRLATDGLDSAALSTLSKQRRELISALVRQGSVIAKAAGQSATPAVLDEVTQTLQAALTDADAANALRTGRLLRPLATVGFEPVDLTEAVAGEVFLVNPGGTPPSARPEPAARQRALELAAQEADLEATAAAARLVQFESRGTELERERDALEDALAEVEARARATRDELERVRRDIRSLDAERSAARRAADSALRAADLAREKAGK